VSAPGVTPPLRVGVVGCGLMETSAATGSWVSVGEVITSTLVTCGTSPYTMA
jgi:hypothetical protein